MGDDGRCRALSEGRLRIRRLGLLSRVRPNDSGIVQSFVRCGVLYGFGWGQTSAQVDLEPCWWHVLAVAAYHSPPSLVWGFADDLASRERAGGLLVCLSPLAQGVGYKGGG